MACVHAGKSSPKSRSEAWTIPFTAVTLICGARALLKNDDATTSRTGVANLRSLCIGLRQQTTRSKGEERHRRRCCEGRLSWVWDKHESVEYPGTRVPGCKVSDWKNCIARQTRDEHSVARRRRARSGSVGSRSRPTL
eukprot:1752197-Rhodomonas_salina.1